MSTPEIAAVKMIGQATVPESRAAAAAELAAGMLHNVMKGDIYLRDGHLWCPTCRQDCPCQCCGEVWASTVAEWSAPLPAAFTRQLPHIAGVEYRSSG